MDSYGASQHQQTKQNFQVKPLHADHPIYMQNTQTARQTGFQKISQSIDIKHIAISIVSKALIITLYFILENFKLLDFIFVILLVSVDFWINKNIQGKQLAGLRWWIELDQFSEEEQWVFQSADPNIEINPINSAFFWLSNLVAAAFWFINTMIILIATSSLFWIGLCLFCLGTTLINLICFYKCRGHHQKKLQQIIERVGLRSATNLIIGTQNMKQEINQQSEGKFQIQ